MSYTPTDVMNEALDAMGWETTIGDAEEGSREARVLIRKYWTALQQMLRAAHWDFARKLAPLTLLADATGNTANVGTAVVQPWLYEYSYPTDCAKARFVPRTGINPNVIAGNWTAPSIWGNGLVENPPGAWGIAGSPNPVPAGPPLGRRLHPAPFILSSDTNYPPALGQELWAVPGVGNLGRTVVLTNVYQAMLCYTEIVLEPQRWDPLFRAAFVSYLASETCFAIHKDKKLGLTVRREQIAITKEKLNVARATNGNEGWANNDIAVDWIEARRGEQWQGPWWGPQGGRCDMGWDNLSFSDGGVF